MILRGPFTLAWGNNELLDIESVEVSYQVNSEDYESGAGNVYQIEKSTKASISLTLLATDIASLAAILPQYFVPENAILSNGSYVFDPRGAIDVLPDDCATEFIYNDLLITACGDPGESIKLLNARTIIDSIEIGKVRKIVVKFIGEPDPGTAIIQLLGDQGEEDFFQLGNDELFLLGDGDNLIL